jgi:hypothetical protein
MLICTERKNTLPSATIYKNSEWNTLSHHTPSAQYHRLIIPALVLCFFLLPDELTYSITHLGAWTVLERPPLSFAPFFSTLYGLISSGYAVVNCVTMSRDIHEDSIWHRIRPESPRHSHAGPVAQRSNPVLWTLCDSWTPKWAPWAIFTNLYKYEPLC